MVDQTKFKNAQEEVKNLSQRPSNDELLSLYGLYKQATEGDVAGPRPGLLSVKERAKWDAWKTLEGRTQEEAMENYTSLVSTLKTSYGSK